MPTLSSSQHFLLSIIFRLLVPRPGGGNLGFLASEQFKDVHGREVRAKPTHHTQLRPPLLALAAPRGAKPYGDCPKGIETLFILFFSRWTSL